MEVTGEGVGRAPLAPFSPLSARFTSAAAPHEKVRPPVSSNTRAGRMRAVRRSLFFFNVLNYIDFIGIKTEKKENIVYNHL